MRKVKGRRQVMQLLDARGRRYRKRPVEIRAVELSEPVIIQTLEGEMRGEIGDMLIEGVAGEFYPCKPHIFSETYERIDESE